MITWAAAEKAMKCDNEAIRIARLELGYNAEVHSLLKRAQEIKAGLQIRSVGAS